MEARSSAQRITCRSRVAIPATVSFGQRFTSSTSADIFQAVSNELQPFEYRRGCLVGNFASEITDATPALKTRVAEHLDDATSRMSVVIEQGQKAGEIRGDIPPISRAVPAEFSVRCDPSVEDGDDRPSGPANRGPKQ